MLDVQAIVHIPVNRVLYLSKGPHMETYRYFLNIFDEKIK